MYMHPWSTNVPFLQQKYIENIKPLKILLRQTVCHLLTASIFIADLAGDGVLVCRCQDGRNEHTGGSGVKGHDDGIHGTLLLVASCCSILDDHVKLNLIGSSSVQHCPFN